MRSEEHTSELQSRVDLVCRLLLEKKKNRLVAWLTEIPLCVLSLTRRPTTPPLFPYTTLFRSEAPLHGSQAGEEVDWRPRGVASSRDPHSLDAGEIQARQVAERAGISPASSE